MKIGFDNQKYLKLQSERILERVAHFGGKLYLEFGGKLFSSVPFAVFHKNFKTGASLTSKPKNGILNTI